MYDITQIRSDFPILQERIYNRPLIYLDNAATTQKPRQVLSVLQEHYCHYNGNVHRGVHYLSNQSTLRFEQARTAIADFLHAQKSEEIIFTKGATEGLNLVCHCFGEQYVQQDDAVIVSEMEHHSNLLPWMMLCKRKGAHLRIIPFDERGELRLDEFASLLDNRVRLVAVTHVSNTLGTINPLEDIIELAHAKNIPVLIDGAQAVAHQKVDVQELDCDFYCFSGHKIFAPNGIGVVYGKERWLNQLSPYQFGGEMVDRVTLSDATFEQLPLKFEAGTPHYIGAIALGAALAYVQALGLDNICRHEHRLLHYAQEKLQRISGIRIFGAAQRKAGIVSFQMKGMHCYDLALLLDKRGIAIRSGSHCTQPIMEHFGVDGTARISLACYNTEQEIDEVCDQLVSLKKFIT